MMGSHATSRNTPVFTIEWAGVRKLTFCLAQLGHDSRLFATSRARFLAFPSVLADHSQPGRLSSFNLQSQLSLVGLRAPVPAFNLDARYAAFFNLQIYESSFCSTRVFTILFSCFWLGEEGLSIDSYSQQYVAAWLTAPLRCVVSFIVFPPLFPAFQSIVSTPVAMCA